MNIFSVLQVAFIVLKVLEKIDWDWWLVFIPTYINIVLYVFLIFIALMLNPGSRKNRW